MNIKEFEKSDNWDIECNGTHTFIVNKEHNQCISTANDKAYIVDWIVGRLNKLAKIERWVNND